MGKKTSYFVMTLTLNASLHQMNGLMKLPNALGAETIDGIRISQLLLEKAKNMPFFLRLKGLCIKIRKR